jgi:hypothetical protein
MTNKLVNVGRVRSVAEATALEDLGVDLIGVAVDPDPRFDDNRTVTVEEAAAIGARLARSALVVTLRLGEDADHTLRIVAATGARLVQQVTAAIPPAGVRAALREAGVGIAYGGIEISHDDDPSWVFSRYADVPELEAAYFHTDVLPEYRDSWAFLRENSPEYPDEFQIADLEDLAAEYPVLVGLDFTPANIREIADAVPSARGLALTLAERATRGDARFHTYADAVRAIEALNSTT